MCEANHGRLFLAWRWKPKSGRDVGVVEEAALNAELGKAMYLSGMMGGATANLIRMFRGDTLSAFDDEGPVHRRYIENLRALSIKDLAERSGLDTNDMKQLFDAQNIDTVMQLTTRGLRTLVQEHRLQPKL